MARTTSRRRTGFIIETDEDVARGIRALRRKCTVLRAIHDATGAPPLRRRPAGLAGLLRIVVGQQVSVASADAIWARCVAHIVPMSALRIAEMSDEEMRACGLSRPKQRTMRAVAAAILDDALVLETAVTQDSEKLREDLLAISGIGPWTTDVFDLFCVGRADAFASGDLAIQIAAQDAFGLPERPDSPGMIELAERWRPWRAIGARLLWAHYAVLKQGRSGLSV